MVYAKAEHPGWPKKNLFTLGKEKKTAPSADPIVVAEVQDMVTDFFGQEKKELSTLEPCSAAKNILSKKMRTKHFDSKGLYTTEATSFDREIVFPPGFWGKIALLQLELQWNILFSLIKNPSSYSSKCQETGGASLKCGKGLGSKERQLEVMYTVSFLLETIHIALMFHLACCCKGQNN